MSFESHYREIYGERWDALHMALLQAAEKFARENYFHQSFPELQPFYFMDQASTFPAQALQLQGHENVLDMCAAPGGKALILAEKVLENGKLTVNEYSRARFERLKQVFCDYVPEELVQKVRFTHFDASKWGMYEPEKYDAILLDAPCSGERHILQDEKEMATWTPARTKQLAKRQYTLLCAGLMSLKLDGKLIYSTCSISPLENDLVIERLLKKKSENCKIVPQEWNVGEKTSYGWQIFPDISNGLGPIYWACIEKR